MRFGESPISRVCTGWDTEIMGFSWNSRDEFARDRDFNNRTGRDRDSEILNGASLDGIEFLDYNGTTGLSRIPRNPAGCSKRENPEESPAFRQGFSRCRTAPRCGFIFLGIVRCGTVRFSLFQHHTVQCGFAPQRWGAVRCGVVIRWTVVSYGAVERAP